MLRSDSGNRENVDVVITVNPDEVRAWAEKHVHHIPAAVALILFRTLKMKTKHLQVGDRITMDQLVLGARDWTKIPWEWA